MCISKPFCHSAVAPKRGFNRRAVVSNPPPSPLSTGLSHPGWSQPEAAGALHCYLPSWIKKE